MPKPTSIRRRLLKLALAVALPLGGLVALAIFQQFQADRKEALAAIHYIQDVNGRVLAGHVAKIRENLAYLANLPHVRALEPGQTGALLRDFAATHPEIAHARLLDTNLNLVASSEPLPPGEEAAMVASPVYREAAAAPAGHISSPHRNSPSMQWSCVASHPVFDDSGVRVGTLVLPLDLQQLSTVLAMPKSSDGFSAGVIDADGLILLRVPEAEKFIGTFKAESARLVERLAVGKRFDREFPDADGVLRTASFAPLPGTPWVLFVSIPTREIYRSAWRSLGQTLAIGAVLFFFCFWLLLRSAGIITKPIEALTAAVRVHATGQTEKSVAITGPTEIAEMMQAFNEMIAARRQAELLLAQSEHRYRTVIDQTGQMIYDLDLATNTIRWFGSEATPAITGFTIEEFQSVDLARWEAMIHPDDRAQATTLLDKALAERAPYHVEYRFRHKDGTHRHIEDHGVFVLDAQGKPERLLGRMSDVTARYLTSVALVESERRYSTVIEQTGQMIYDLDYATNTARWFGSEATSAITGYTLTEFQEVGLARWEEMIHPEDRAKAIVAMERSLAEQKRYHVEYRFRHKDGSYRHIEDHGVFLFNADGSPKRWLGRLSDVTARHLASAALVESERRYSTVIEQTGQMIYDMDALTGEVRWFGDAATGQILGCTPEELSRLGVGGWRERLHPEDREAVIARLEHSLRTGEPCGVEYRLRHRDGTYRFVVERGAVLRNAAGVIHRMVGRLNDITERRKIEEERRQLEIKILHTQKLESLGVLAGGIAHDFNNLLTSILGYASLARLELPPSAPVLTYLEKIDTGARRAAELCNQMLAYSGKGRFVVQRLDLNQLVTETTHLLTLSISKTSVLRFHLAQVLPAVMADATQMRQIVMNLVLNASEAIGHRSGVIAISTGVARVDRDYLLTLRHSEDLVPGDYAFLEVSDTGHGMTAETIDRVFDPFFTTKFTGRGLGLAAVLGIVRGHKGAIKIYSEVGRGTTFKAFFPCVTGSVETALLPGATVANAPRTVGSGHVLVVDDEETIRTVVARMLEHLGYTTEIANDGREAVEKFRADPARYHAVLLDLTMPHLDGEETFRQLRHLRPGVRVVLMSGFNEQEAIGRFTGTGLAGFVQKPFEVAALAAAMRTVTLAG